MSGYGLAKAGIPALRENREVYEPKLIRRNISVFALAAALPAARSRRQRPRAAQGEAGRAPGARAAPRRPAPSPGRRSSTGCTERLEVIVLEDHSVPLVTVELAVRNGAFTEPPELNGLSHLFEHMFFKVSPSRGRITDYMRNIDSLGIVYNGETHEEVVNYYFTTTTPNFPVACSTCATRPSTRASARSGWHACAPSARRPRRPSATRSSGSSRRSARSSSAS